MAINPAHGQEEVTEMLVNRVLQDEDAGGEELIIDESMIPDLEYMRKHPIDLNRVSKDELIINGLFTVAQAEALHAHIVTYGRLLAIEELQVNGVMSDAEIIAITPFVVVTDPGDISATSPGDLLRAGKYEIFLRSYSVLERSKGYKSELRPYPGIPFSSMLRFRFNSRNRLIAGFIMENDPGELVPAKGRVADFISWHVYMKSDRVLRRLAIGDYLVGYGQGLTYAGFGRSGLSFDASQVFRPQTGIRPYRSVTEGGFLRGAAASLRKGKMAFDMFCSNMNEDATLYVGEDGETTFRGINTSGLHRTGSEQLKRNSVSIRSHGAHMSWHPGTWDLGITAARIIYSAGQERSDKLYGYFDPTGTATTRTGFSYSGRIRNVHLFGEVCINDRQQTSFLSGAMVQLHSKLLWTVLFRDYAAGRSELMTDPVARTSGNNEKGIYNGLNFHFSRFLSLNLFNDIYQKPWLAYSDNLPGYGIYNGIRVVYKPDRYRELLIQFRARASTTNHTTDDHKFRQQAKRSQSTYRVQYRYTTSTKVTFRTRIEFSSSISPTERSHGFMVYQDLIYKPLMRNYGINLRFVMFDTDDYNARIYAYENNVLYAYSIPAYYYKGYRYYLLISYKFHDRITAWARFARTIYMDRDSIGSGNDLIERNTKSVIDLQLRYSI